MPGRKKRGDDPLEPYRRVRKPVPPPGRVIPDRRRKIREDEAERERRELEGRARSDDDRAADDRERSPRSDRRRGQ